MGNLCRSVSFWVPSYAGIIKALSSDLREVVIDFRDTGETACLYRSDRRRSEATERLPHDITRISGGAENTSHELQGLLVKMCR
jgi:hypothetical protein